MSSRRIDLFQLAPVVLGCAVLSGCRGVGDRWAFWRSHDDCPECRRQQALQGNLAPVPDGGPYGNGSYDNPRPTYTPGPPQAPPTTVPSAPPALPRIPMPQLQDGAYYRGRSGGRQPTLLERVKFGLRKLNPVRRPDPTPTTPRPAMPPSSRPRLQPIPESSLPAPEGPTAQTAPGTPTVPVASRATIEQWPHSTRRDAKGSASDPPKQFHPALIFPRKEAAERSPVASGPLQRVPADSQVLVAPPGTYHSYRGGYGAVPVQSAARQTAERRVHNFD